LKDRNLIMKIKEKILLKKNNRTREEQETNFKNKEQNYEKRFQKTENQSENNDNGGENRRYDNRRYQSENDDNNGGENRRYENRRYQSENDDNNGGENRRYDNRRYQSSGYRGRGSKNYRGGNNYVQKDRRTGKFQQDFDLFESTKLFQKEKEMAKIEEQVKEMKIDGGNITNEEPEHAYDPEKSIYDTLSCETFERMNNKKINRREKKNKLQEEQQRIDHETFGFVPYDRRNDYNNYNPKKRYYSNNQNQRPKNTRNQYTNTRPGQKQTTVRKFRPVNKDKTEST